MLPEAPGIIQSLGHFLGGEGASTGVKGSHPSSDCEGRTTPI